MRMIDGQVVKAHYRTKNIHKGLMRTRCGKWLQLPDARMTPEEIFKHASHWTMRTSSTRRRGADLCKTCEKLGEE